MEQDLERSEEKVELSERFVVFMLTGAFNIVRFEFTIFKQ